MSGVDNYFSSKLESLTCNEFRCPITICTISEVKFHCFNENKNLEIKTPVELLLSQVKGCCFRCNRETLYQFTCSSQHFFCHECHQTILFRKSSAKRYIRKIREFSIDNVLCNVLRPVEDFRQIYICFEEYDKLLSICSVCGENKNLMLSFPFSFRAIEKRLHQFGMYPTLDDVMKKFETHPCIIQIE